MSWANMVSKVALLQDHHYSIDLFYLILWEILRMEGCVENLAIFMFSWKKCIRTSSFSYHQHADPNGCLKPLVRRHCSADLAIKIILVRFDTSWLHLKNELAGKLNILYHFNVSSVNLHRSTTVPFGKIPFFRLFLAFSLTQSAYRASVS